MLHCSNDTDCPENVCFFPLFSDVGTCLELEKIPFPNLQVNCGDFYKKILMKVLDSNCVSGLLLSDVPVCVDSIHLLLLLPQAPVPQVQDGSFDFPPRELLGDGPWMCRSSNPSQTELGGNHKWFVLCCWLVGRVELISFHQAMVLC